MWNIQNIAESDTRTRIQFGHFQPSPGNIDFYHLCPPPTATNAILMPPTNTIPDQPSISEPSSKNPQSLSYWENN